MNEPERFANECREAARQMADDAELRDLSGRWFCRCLRR